MKPDSVIGMYMSVGAASQTSNEQQSVFSETSSAFRRFAKAIFGTGP
jgi:hypothetical protein